MNICDHVQFVMACYCTFSGCHISNICIVATLIDVWIIHHMAQRSEKTHNIMIYCTAES